MYTIHVVISIDKYLTGRSALLVIRLIIPYTKPHHVTTRDFFFSFCNINQLVSNSFFSHLFFLAFAFSPKKREWVSAFEAWTWTWTFFCFSFLFFRSILTRREGRERREKRAYLAQRNVWIWLFCVTVHDSVCSWLWSVFAFGNGRERWFTF